MVNMSYHEWSLCTEWHTKESRATLAYGLKPEVWGRVGPDPRAELQVDPAIGLGRPVHGCTKLRNHSYDSIK